MAAAREAGDRDRRVVRPHRAPVVAQRPVAARGGGHGAQPVAGVHVGSGEPVGDGRLLRSVEQPAAQQVPDVARQGVDRPLVGVQRDGRVRARRVLDPEARPEPSRQVGGPPAPALGAGPAERVEQVRAGQRGLVRIALDLAQRDRTDSERPVAPLHRVTGVLPALVRQAPGRVRVLQEPVAVTVAVVGHPRQRPFHGGQQRLDLVGLKAPAPGVVQQAHPQRGRVGRAVVDRRQHASAVAEVERLVADLVQDLARLLSGDRVDHLTLARREHAQGPGREVCPEREHHARRPQRVAAEQREEPGRTRRQERVGRREGRAHAQAGEVFGCARQQPWQPAVVAVDHGGRPLRPRRRRRPDDARDSRCHDGPLHYRGGARHHRRPPGHAGRQRVTEVDRRVDAAQGHAGGVVRPLHDVVDDPARHARCGPAPLLDLVHVRQVAREGHLDEDLDRLVRRARQLQTLADRPWVDLPQPAKLHDRVRALPGGPAQQRHRLDRARSGRAGRNRLRLDSVGSQDRARDDPHVTVVAALSPGRAHLTIDRGPRLGGRHGRDEQVVQQRLVLHRCLFLNRS